MHISFINKGLIDIRAITTLGVSVKETENPIGYFGTGLKYAIAVVLREGGDISIWRGLEELRFHTKQVSIRGKSVQLVCLNDQELSFTTEFGKNWEIWQAFRELYCNAKDEGGFAGEGIIQPQENTTTIHVNCQGMLECFRNIHEYFMLDTPIYKGTLVNFHRRTTTGIFYRTILAGNIPDQHPFKYAPNIIESIPLTEDRTIRSIWDAYRDIAREILENCLDREFLYQWLTTGPLYAEYHIDLDWSAFNPSKTFLEVATDLASDFSRPINRTVLRVLARHAHKPEPSKADIFASEAAILQDAIQFCRELKYPVDEFEIIVTESLGDGILGQADREKRKIYLSRRTIQNGKLMCAATLIEEWVHIRHNLDDCSREMQNWLLEQVSILGAELLNRRDV